MTGLALLSAPAQAIRSRLWNVSTQPLVRGERRGARRRWNVNVVSLLELPKFTDDRNESEPEKSLLVEMNAVTESALSGRRGWNLTERRVERMQDGRSAFLISGTK